MNTMQKAVAVIAGISALAAGNAYATAPDYSTLVSSVDFSTVITSAMTVGSAAAGVYVVLKGIRLVIRTIRGA